MRRVVRLGGGSALVLATLLGTWAIVSVSAGVAFADDGPGPTPAPVTVVIPGPGGQSPTPTPSPNSNSGSGSGAVPIARTGSGGGSPGGASTSAPHKPGTEPKVPKHPAIGTLKVAISPAGVLSYGERITVSTKGFNPAEKVQMVIYYDRQKPVKIGNFVADASGSISRTFDLPQLDAGTDAVQLTGWDSSKVGTGDFLVGASWVAARPAFVRTMWLWVGGLTGLGAFTALVWFGIASLRRIPAAEAGV